MHEKMLLPFFSSTASCVDRGGLSYITALSVIRSVMLDFPFIIYEAGMAHPVTQVIGKLAAVDEQSAVAVRAKACSS